VKISEKLQARINSEIGIEIELPERLHRQWSGRAAGQWAWTARRKPGHGAGDIGSEFTMSECVKAKSLHLDKDPYGSWYIAAEGGES
jgi:hypothetical protein